MRDLRDDSSIAFSRAIRQTERARHAEQRDAMDIRIETKRDHIRVWVTGEFDLAQAREGLLRIAQLCRDARLDRVLIDGRGVSNRVPVGERQAIAKVISDEASVRLRMAVVVSRENMFTKALEETSQSLGVEVHTTDSMAEGLMYLDLLGER